MSAVAATTGAAATTIATNPKSATLDQAAFLKLMTTQLQTQDPFNPIDNTQMIAQMAQFSSVAGIAEMNSSLKTIAADITGSRLGDASGWIGRSALVPSDTATMRPDGSFAGEIALPVAASAASLSLVDASGSIVHSERLGAQEAGTSGFRWDGLDASGKPVAGPLRVVVNAQDANGVTISAGIATWTSVTAIQSPAGGSSTRLVTPLGLFAPTDAKMIG